MKRSSPSFLSEDQDITRSIPRESIDSAALRVLLSDSLEEKLRPIAKEFSSSSDVRSEFEDHAKLVPGRPGDLRFARKGSSRPKFPAAPALLNERSRGVLLHFFANHELLAAELMALALLRFPDAPEAFRLGLAETLREEQFHTRWYIQRMKECGVTFGEFPVNRFFWDAVSDMTCPMDYVSRLSLTFEQANLDYALHYGNMFEEAGDAKTARILKTIYRDEISHVGYGLTWFRKWKDEKQSDWEAFNKKLIFPLSPSRAKGTGVEFNAIGRKEAGLGEAFVQELDLFDRSRGRTPNVLYFNPEAENRIGALPKTYSPTKRICSVIEDLEILCVFLSSNEDVVLMRRPPSKRHRQKLKQAGFVLPEIEKLNGNQTIGDENLICSRKINQILPWSASPDLPALFRRVDAEKSSRLWNEKIQPLFSKSTQSKRLSEWMGPGAVCTSTSDFLSAVSDLRESGHLRAFLKNVHSVAGGGHRAIDLERPLDSFKFSEGREWLVEPFDDRIFDFSVQFSVTDSSIKKLGMIHQVVDENGGYRGSRSFIKNCAGLSADLSRFLMEEALPLYEPESDLIRTIHEWTQECGFSGPLGIDAYVYRDGSENLKIRPVCEINPRFTMGRVTLELRKRVAPGFNVCFKLLPAIEAKQRETALEFSPSGKLSGGTVILNELHPESRFAILLTVSKDVRILQEP